MFHEIRALSITPKALGSTLYAPLHIRLKRSRKTHILIDGDGVGVVVGGVAPLAEDAVLGVVGGDGDAALGGGVVVIPLHEAMTLVRHGLDDGSGAILVEPEPLTEPISEVQPSA